MSPQKINKNADDENNQDLVTSRPVLYQKSPQFYKEGKASVTPAEAGRQPLNNEIMVRVWGVGSRLQLGCVRKALGHREFSGPPR